MQLLEFLYHSSIVLIVYERYEEAAEKLEMLLKLERDDSNLKTDAEKKLAIIYSFIGKNSQALTAVRK
jgi:tetratricopeptide (TPR) repeat protein